MRRCCCGAGPCNDCDEQACDPPVSIVTSGWGLTVNGTQCTGSVSIPSLEVTFSDIFPACAPIGGIWIADGGDVGGYSEVAEPCVETVIASAGAIQCIVGDFILNTCDFRKWSDYAGGLHYIGTILFQGLQSHTFFFAGRPTSDGCIPDGEWPLVATMSKRTFCDHGGAGGNDQRDFLPGVRPDGDGSTIDSIPTFTVATGSPLTGSPSLASPQARRRSEPCQFRGPEVDRVPCQSCKGTVKLKVFQCGLHGRCTINRKAGDDQCCARCGDFVPREQVLVS